MSNMWLMIEADEVGVRDELVAARVPFTSLTIAHPREVTGVAFPGDGKEHVLEILGLTEVIFTEVSTNIEGVLLLQPQAEEQAARKVVIDSRGNLECFSEMEPVLEEYATRLGVEIHVSNPHGEPSEPKTEDGKLFLRFWSAPVRTARSYVGSAFGIALQGSQSDGLRPSGEGFSISDSDENVLAEIVGGTLYILFDLPHRRGAGKLLRLIMEQYMFLQKSPDEQAKLLRRAAANELRKARKAYVKECAKRVTATRDSVQRAIRDSEAYITSYQERIIRTVRDLSENRQRLEELQKVGTQGEEKYALEFDKLLTVPGVVKVAVRDDIISVFTEQIDIPYGGLTYDIGKFRIDIHTDGSYGGVTCHNLTRDISSYGHPHVHYSGQCCLGNIASGVASLVGEYEYAVLAQLMLRYLHTVNRGDWYQEITEWPVKGEAERSGVDHDSDYDDEDDYEDEDREYEHSYESL